MPNYLGSRLLMEHIDQYLDGRAPGGVAGMGDFFGRHHVRPDDVVEALQVAGRGDFETVAQFVHDHPELKDWFTRSPRLTMAAG
jgi:hypothetical protein